MKLFDDDGNLDFEAARAELKATGTMTGATIKAERLQALGVAALIDIASSLSIVALEAAQAMNLEGIVTALNAEDDATETGDRDFFLVGDLVHVLDDTEPGEVVKLGFDQGEAFAVVDFANGHTDRYYVRNLVRIVGDEAPESVAENAVALVDTALELTDPPEITDLDALEEAAEAFDEFADDLDEDFDETPAEEVTALDKLDAKPAKKKGKK